VTNQLRPDPTTQPVWKRDQGSAFDRAVRTFTVRLADTLQAESTTLAAELKAVAEAERDAAVERLRTELERDVAERVLLARTESETVRAEEVERIREEGARALADQLQRVRVELEVAHAAEIARLTNRPDASSSRPPDAADQTLDTLSRLLRLTRTLDDARSLTEVLETLVEGLQQDATRGIILTLDEGRQRPWRFVGYPETPAGLAGDPLTASLVARAVSSADTCFLQFPSLPAGPNGAEITARGLAIPITSSGKVVAVVYADNTGATASESPAWAEVIEILVRHAARAVEALGTRATPDTALAARTQVTPAAPLEPYGSKPYTGSLLSERRKAPRMRASELPWVGGAQLLPGRRVALINLSEAGALVECDDRLMPDTRVVLQLMGIKSVSRVTARVVRCVSAGHDAARGGRYHGAVVFTEPMRETPRSSYVALPLR
jgi:hypothetical protein